MDRIRKDPVFRMNLTMQGGWTEETYHILIELIQVAKDRKRWNQLFGGIPYEQRIQFYHQRDQWYRASGRDRLPVFNYPGADENQTRDAHRLGKGSHVAAASRTPTIDPTPEVQFREIWQIAQAERMGFESTDEFLQEAQWSAPDGAAGSSTDAIAPVTLLPRSNKYRCLQCRELAAAEDLWECEHCTSQAGKSIRFHRPTHYHNCFRAHERFCRMATMFEWRRD